MKLVISVICLLFTLPATSYCTVINIMPNAAVSSDVIKISDVTLNEIPEVYADIVIGKSARSGKQIEISKQQILRKLVEQKQASGVRFTGSESCIVKTEGRALQQAEIKSALMFELGKLLPERLDGAPESSIETKNSMPEISIGNSWSLLVDQKPLSAGRNLVRVSVNSGKRVTRFTSTVICHIWGQNAITKDFIPKGQPIADSAVKWTWVDMATADRFAINSRHSLVGMVAATDIVSGTTLRKPDLKMIPLVHQGEPVEMKIERSGIAISASGIARRDGAHNQIIPVISDIDGRVVSGRVIGPGLVAWRR